MTMPETTRQTPELERLTLGFIPLIDAALLVIAREGGFFTAQGLDVSLSRENAWSTLRDKVAAGLLDGAQMLSPLPLAMSLGLGRAPCDTLAPVILGRNGNSLTLSDTLCEQSGAALTADPAVSARALADWQRRQPVGKRPRLAMVHPFSCQHFQLREWLAMGGMDADHDVALVVLPPPRMVDALREGRIDGFCAGEPWGTLARHRGVGRLVASGAQLWPDHPEKVLGVTASWARHYPATLSAMIRAIREASAWLGRSPDHARQARDWLALPPYLDRAMRHLDALSLDSAPLHQRLHGPDALRPTRQGVEHVAEHIDQYLRRQGQALDPNALEACYSPVHYDAATHSGGA